MSEDAAPQLTERLRHALDARAAAAPGTTEFEHAQAEVDRLVLVFVGHDRSHLDDTGFSDVPPSPAH